MSTPLNPDEFTHAKKETEPKEPCEQDDHANAQGDAPHWASGMMLAAIADSCCTTLEQARLRW
ncbi:MAG: hypothetical protein J2P37_21530 [Ktedonobacteraceae bacterium]|nr:hypothetical protein [Ktedonobacteraceae bacterium]MBO0790326.1 hypothetical protein [Ktedonobacteraceae bacterium]